MIVIVSYGNLSRRYLYEKVLISEETIINTCCHLCLFIYETIINIIQSLKVIYVPCLIILVLVLILKRIVNHKMYK